MGACSLATAMKQQEDNDEVPRLVYCFGDEFYWNAFGAIPDDVIDIKHMYYGRLVIDQDDNLWSWIWNLDDKTVVWSKSPEIKIRHIFPIRRIPLI